ncbi:hypothetical protein SAVIM40S_07752 [Streptomyces avidinii]
MAASVAPAAMASTYWRQSRTEVSWHDVAPDADPRLLFGLTELSFGTPNRRPLLAPTEARHCSS